MTTQLIVYDTANRVEPTEQCSMYQISYSKANTGDTLLLSTYAPQIKNIIYVLAFDDTAGALDPVTWSGVTITFSSGTGSGSLIVVGTC